MEGREREPLDQVFNDFMKAPRKLSMDEAVQLRLHQNANLLSQFLHGEQGALIATAKIVQTVPWEEAKFYAANQVADEARHVEVFAAYIRLLDDVHPIMPSLKKLLDATLGRESWLHKLVGMQVVGQAP